MCLDQGPQRSDAVEARTRGLSVSSQALYHWATALPRRRWSWAELATSSLEGLDIFYKHMTWTRFVDWFRINEHRRDKTCLQGFW